MLALTLLGPIDVLGQEVAGGVTLIEFLLLGLVVVNLVVRFVAHRGFAAAAREGGADAISRSLLLDATDLLIVLGAFYYTTIAVHAGVVFSVLAIGLLLTDFFEFEARLVEARTEAPLERPKSALFASALVFAYIAFQSLMFLADPLVSEII